MVGERTSTEHKYISVYAIMEKLSRDMQGIEFEESSVIEWCGEVIKEIGLFWLIDKEKEFEIVNGQVCLPCDFYKLNKGGVSINYESLEENTSGFNQYDRLLLHNDRLNKFYKIVDNIITFNITRGKVWISYKAIPIDEEGYPMILDGFEHACYYYCLYKLMMKDWITGKLDNQRFKEIQRLYSHHVMKARTNQKSIDENTLETYSKVWANMTPLFNKHFHAYRTIAR